MLIYFLNNTRITAADSTEYRHTTDLYKMDVATRSTLHVAHKVKRKVLQVAGRKGRAYTVKQNNNIDSPDILQYFRLRGARSATRRLHIKTFWQYQKICG